jgi:hypothetical protein
MEEVSEAELLEAGRQGRVLDCAGGGTGAEGRRPVDAALLRRCCLELKDQIDPRGLRLQQATVTGPVDLAGLEVPFPLRFEGCDFDSALRVAGAQLRELALIGTVRLPGLLGNGLRVRGDLDLSGSRVAGAHATTASINRRSAIWLCEADIGGLLLCLGTSISARGERAIQADRMRVGGTVRLGHRFTAEGEVRLLGARIGGSLDLGGAHIDSPGRTALDLGDAAIGGNLFLTDDPAGRRSHIRGRLDMGSARVSGQFLIRNATLEGAGTAPADHGYASSRRTGTAMSATRLSVGAELALEGVCEVTGGLDLSMSELSTLSISAECSLRAAGRTALDLSNAELRSSLLLNGVTVQGTIRLSGARIHGTLSLTGASLSAPERDSLIAARGAVVDGDVELVALRATGGTVRLSNTTLGSVVAVGAQLSHPSDVTLNLHQATVRGSVILSRGFASAGLVFLSRSVVTGRLECAGGQFEGPDPEGRNGRDHAIEAVSADIRGGMDLTWARASPSVDLTDASTTFLADDPAHWPDRIFLSGFTYDRFEPSRRADAARTWDYQARAAWLARQAVYDAGPYEQAARVFREHGYTNEAESILVAQRTQARQLIRGRGAAVRRALDRVFGATVAYGYRPGRVLWLLVALLILVLGSLEIPAAQATLRATTAVGTVYTTRGALPAVGVAPGQRRVAATGAQPDVCGDGQVRCFSPVLYTIDTVVPLVSLAQRSTWYPDPHAPDGSFMEWWLNAATLLGWVLSSIFVLSLTRLARAS